MLLLFSCVLAFIEEEEEEDEEEDEEEEEEEEEEAESVCSISPSFVSL